MHGTILLTTHAVSKLQASLFDKEGTFSGIKEFRKFQEPDISRRRYNTFVTSLRCEAVLHAGASSSLPIPMPSDALYSHAQFFSPNLPIIPGALGWAIGFQGPAGIPQLLWPFSLTTELSSIFAFSISIACKETR